MAVTLKSNVLSRDEKGFLGIPFKRLLLGGVVGGFFYTAFDLVMPGSGVLVGIGGGLASIILTGTRGGLPLWQRLIMGFRGWLLLAAYRNSKGIWAETARMLQLPTDKVRVDAAQLFAPVQEVEIDLREWETYTSPQEVEKGGLVFVDAPMQEVL